MRRNTYPTLTGFAAHAEASRKYLCSTGKRQRPRAGGPGIAIALSAAELPAGNMERERGRCETPGFGSGEKITRRLPPHLTPESASRTSMAFPLSKLNKCGRSKVGAALFVSGRHLGFLSITAIRRVTCAPFFARHATLSSDGMKRRRRPFLNFNDMWSDIGSREPCHGDVLLERANR